MTKVEPIIGKYVHVNVDGIEYRTYFESNGSGIPLVCLHTAGADALEYRHLLADEDITKNFQVIAFDMPWHGRSLPPSGWWENEYKLTQRFYMDFIIAFTEALELDRSILMGCSMGGYVMLDIAHEHPGKFGGLIALQPRDFEPAWAEMSKWMVHPEVNPANIIRPLIRSLTSSQAPEDYRREVEWIYARCGPGVLSGDFFYASKDHDARPFLEEIDAEEQGLYVIGGDEDYSCYPEHTNKLKSSIKGLKVTRIPGVGHFPPSEHPAAFKQALTPILNELRATYEKSTV
ncbi:alpha/beta hydrolase [Bacillus sp. HMSC76G11]|nr:alpha/beta hydrolase [Bacillus sp. HMSC76G11]